ncbi:hypothetical protein TWF481_002512 [Arthrobotrys musiformis]|uniref:Mid2 domain-containing protein n=1 Tax=Arthrobotrys musiformis TaxID=47236 RepID=A0AAV9VVA0_9PEZI
MKPPSTTFLVCLFPILAPTLAFAHARPHPHPHARAAGGRPDISDVEKLKLKRQLPVLNDTIIPIESETTSSTTSSTTLPPLTTTSKSTINLDDALSSIESGVLGGGDTTTTTATSSEPAVTTTSAETTTTKDTSTTAASTTSQADDASSSSPPSSSSPALSSTDPGSETTSSEDLSLPTSIPSPTVTSGVTTGLNTPSLTVQPPIPVETTSDTTSEAETTSVVSSSSTRSQIPIIETLSDILTSLLPQDSTSTSSSDADAITTSAGTKETSETTASGTKETTDAETTADPTTTAPPESTTEATTTSKPGLDDVLSSILSGVVSDVTSSVDVTTLPPNATDVVSTTVPDVTSVITDLPTTTEEPTSDPTAEPTDDPTSEPTDVPTTTTTTEPTAEPTADTTTSDPSAPTTEPPVETTPPPDTTVIPSTDLPSNSTSDPTSVITDLPPTGVTTSLPTSDVATTSDGVTSAPGTDIPDPTTALGNSTVIPPETSITSGAVETTPTLEPTITSVDPSSVSLTDALPTITSETQLPPPDLDTSSLWFGTSLVTQGTPTASDQSSIAVVPTSLPSGVPEAITPPGGVPEEPDNSTLIQIGFTREYNYAFVSDSLQSAAQICDFLPKGLADGLGVDRSQLRMHSLQPLQPDGLDYIVTLGLVYIPTIMLNKLTTDIHIPLSDLYNNRNPTIKAFMNTIDPSIPLIPGEDIALKPPSNTGSSGGGDPNDPSWVKDGDNIVDGSQATSTAGTDQIDGADPYSAKGGVQDKTTPKTVTIGIASVGAAALYGVAMYFLAKRYRRNRLSHRRSQSLAGGGIEPPQMSDTRSSGALSPMMSTHFFNNGRTTPTTPVGSDKRGSKGSKTSARGQISAPMMSENSLGWD